MEEDKNSKNYLKSNELAKEMFEFNLMLNLKNIEAWVIYS